MFCRVIQGICHMCIPSHQRIRPPMRLLLSSLQASCCVHIVIKQPQPHPSMLHQPRTPCHTLKRREHANTTSSPQVQRHGNLHQVSAIYCPPPFFSSQNSLASSSFKFPFAIATSINALSTPTPIPLPPTANTRPSNALITNHTKSA